MANGARSRITPTCAHGGTLGACLDCHREKNGWDPVAGSTDDSAGPTTSHPGAIVLRESGQNYFISTIAHDDPGHWTICKEKALWGTRLPSSKAASEVRADDPDSLFDAFWPPEYRAIGVVRSPPNRLTIGCGGDGWRSA
jgi:hypothetical protein